MWKHCKRNMEPLGRRLKLAYRQVRHRHWFSAEPLTPYEELWVDVWIDNNGIWF